jgi:hypothetical protein
MPDMGKKQCSKCKRIKLRSCFTKNKSTPDGLDYSCKECKREFEREYKRELRRSRRISLEPIHIVPATGIENAEQIDSLIREMAELQANINHEKAQCKTRISLVKKYTDEIIEPFISHQIAIRVMLLDFLKKQEDKTFSHKYRFGVVSFSCGKLKLSLCTDLARQEMDIP